MTVATSSLHSKPPFRATAKVRCHTKDNIRLQSALAFAVSDDRVLASMAIQTLVGSLSGIVGDMKAWVRLIRQNVSHIEKLKQTCLAVAAGS